VASITRRTTDTGESRYDVRLRLPDRVLTKTFRRRSDAERWARRQDYRKDLGDLVDPQVGAQPLAAYAAIWLKGRDLAPRTRELYQHLYKKWIAPEFGTTALNRIVTDAVRRWHADITSEVSPIQAAKAYRLLRAILNTAVADGLLARNPCCIPGAGQERSPERPLVEPADVMRLADAIAPEHRVLVLLAAVAALRVGELLALRRLHVDVDACTVQVVEQAVELRDGTRLTTPPKTTAGVRTVAVPPFLADELQDHLDRHVADRPDALLFTGPKGTPLRRVALQRSWTAARAATGMTDIHLHDLRHAGATLAAWSGASVKELMARLGHTTPRAALRYQHAAASRDHEIAARLGEIFDPHRRVRWLRLWSAAR
jgi:integrase